MDERIEALTFGLEGEDANAVRQGVRVALSDFEQLFRAQEVNRRMKDNAAHACHALCRARILEEIRCGAVRYRLKASPLTVYSCHCKDCQPSDTA